jgi:hypothetical protein
MPYKDKEDRRAYQRERAARAREEWIKENGPCKRCGRRDQLEIDHVDRTDKELRASQVWHLAKDNPKRVAELAKCQVLCTDCHLDKSIKEKQVPCTARLRERRGCGCEDCKALNAAHKRKLRK